MHFQLYAASCSIILLSNIAKIFGMIYEALSVGSSGAQRSRYNDHQYVYDTLPLFVRASPGFKALTSA